MDDIQKIKDENEKLKMMNENKSNLIFISAHQIRTSLSALKWILKMFSNKELGDINSEQKDYIEKAISSNERIISIVNNLLSLNHSDETCLTLNLKQVNFPNILEKIIFEFSGETKNKNINIVYNKAETLTPEIKCDEDMIIVVLQNLIENAI